MAGLKMKYFVLNPRGKGPDDPYALASREAMAAYANAIYNADPQLTNDLQRWLNSEYERRVMKRKKKE